MPGITADGTGVETGEILKIHENGDEGVELICEPKVGERDSDKRRGSDPALREPAAGGERKQSISYSFVSHVKRVACHSGHT